MDLQPGVPVLRRDLVADGHTDDEVRRLCRTGALLRLRWGAYLPAPAEPLEPVELHRLAVHAAVRTVSPDAVVSHASAAVLHGIGAWRIPLDRVELTRNRRSGARTGPGLRLHAATLSRDEVTEVDGIPVTTVARTVADLARTLPFVPAVAAADAAMFAELVGPEELADAVARSARRPGTPAARRVLASADGRADGPGESRSRLLFRSVGIPAPDLQRRLRDGAGRRLGQVDFWWDGPRVAGEFDGRVKYGRLAKPGQTPADVVWAEKLREDAIRAEGVSVVRWVWADLRDRAAFARTAERLHRALRGSGRRPSGTAQGMR